MTEGIPESPDVQDAAKRDQQAAELRMAGATYAQIATRLGYYDHSHARQSILRVLGQGDGNLRDEFRSLSLARSERLLRGVWANAVGGDLHAVDAALALMNRQARLLGLDAPTQIAVSDTTRSELLTLIQDLEEGIETLPGEVVPEVTVGDDGDGPKPF